MENVRKKKKTQAAGKKKKKADKKGQRIMQQPELQVAKKIKSTW